MATLYHGTDVRMVDYTPSADVAAGDIIQIGTTQFIAHLDIADGTLGALAAGGGVYKAAPAAATALTEGVPCYWDGATVTTVAAGAGSHLGFTTPMGQTTLEAVFVHNPDPLLGI